MLTIRLQRTGTKNRSSFRIVLAQKEKSAGKKFLEVLGHYNPRLKQFGIKDDSRLKYWIGKHVELSPTVQNLLIEKKLMDGKKVKAWTPKKKEGAEVAAETQAQAAPQTEAPKTEETPTETPTA